MLFVGFVMGALALVPLVFLQQRRIVAARRGQQGAVEGNDILPTTQVLLEAIPCPVFFKAPDGRYLGCNNAFAKYIGRRRDEIIGHTVHDLAPRELAERYAAADADLLARTGAQAFTMEVPCADGSLRDLVMHKSTYRSADGLLGGIVGVIVDFTERNFADRMLRQSEQKFRSLAERLPANVIRYDRQARVLYMNPAYEASVATEVKVKQGEMLVDSFPGSEAAENHHRIVEQVIATGMPAESDFQIRNARGEMRVHRVNYVADYDGDGEIVGALAIGHDVTEYRQTVAFEQFRSRTLELLSGDESLQELLAAIVRGVAHLSGELDFCLLLLDRQGEQAAMGIAASLPDCCKAAIDGIERGPGAGGWRLVAATGKSFVAADGNLGANGVPAAQADFEVCRSVPICSSVGHLLGIFVGHCHEGYLPTEFDISIIGNSARLASIAIERRRAEEALRASELKFRALAENLPDYIARYDREGRWVYLNRQLAELLGVEARDVLGTPVWPPAVSDEGCARYLACLQSVLKTGQSAEIDVALPDGGNGVRYHNIRFIAEQGPDGEIIGALSIGRDVTERKQIQRQMEIQTAALNNSNDAVFVLDDTLRFVFVNETACRSLGYSREELQTMGPFDIDPNVTPEIAQAIQTEVKCGVPPPPEFETRHQAKDGDNQPVQVSASLFELIDGVAPPAEFETYHRAKDGRIFPVEVFASSFRYEGRSFGLSVVRDIADRKRLEDALQFVAQRGWEEDSKRFFDVLVCYLGKSLGVDYALIARLDASHASAETVAVFAKGAVVQNFHYDLSGTPCDNVIGKRYCCYPSGVQTQFPDDGPLVDMAAESYAGIPLWDSGGQPLGLIAVLGRQPLQNEGWVAKLLHLVAPRVAAELERARSDALLREREQEYRTLAESLPDYIARYDREGRWVYLNRQLAELLGVEARDVLGTPVWPPAVSDEGCARYLACLQSVLKTGQSAEIDVAWPDGGNGVRYHNIRFVPERGPDGEVVGALSIGRDVTERQQTQRQMEIQTAALNNSNDAFFVMDDTLRFIFVNDTACRSLGYSREELLTMRPFDIDPNVTPEVEQAIQAHVKLGVPPPEEGEIRYQAKNGSPQPLPIAAFLFKPENGVAPPAEFETIHRAKDGRTFPVEIFGSSFRFEGRNFGLSVVRDITERKRYQETLSAREREFRSLAENAPDNIVRFDCQGRILYANPRLEKTMGVVAAEIVGKFPQEVVPTWDGAAVDGVLANGEPVEIDFAVPDRTGMMRQYQIRLAPERNPQGEIIGVLGIGRDVTRKKCAERDMLVLNSAINNASDGILLVSQQFRILYVNDRACRTLGYTRKQLLSMTTDDIITEVGIEKAGFIRAGLLEQDSVVRTDIQARTANGRIFPIELSASLVEYEGEKMALVLARDVTEHRRMESALRLREEEFRSLARNLPDIVMRYDLECRHIYVNPAYLQEVEVHESELLMKTPCAEHWRSPTTRVDDFVAELRRAMSAGESTELMVDWLRRGNGGLANYAMRIVAERAADDRVIGALCIGRNVTKLVESERRLQDSRRQLRELAARREAAREEERRHIAREIHDELGQQLSALRFKLGLLAYDFGGVQPEMVGAVDNLTSLVSKAIQTTRAVSSALRPVVLDLGIVPALEWLVAEYSHRGGVSFRMRLTAEEVRLDGNSTIALFRIVQESLTNAVRHSKANDIVVEFGREADFYVVEVRDDGVGFDVNGQRDRRSTGLIGISERAFAVGAELDVTSAPGRGTVLRVRIPAAEDGRGRA